ncbi:ATP-binding protein [Streptomyces sp. NPDC126514]|uniref:ATP-binding protein n=1 Tax=Streptomyces sp. NPDC126514 TaxID=3155210 RepID=UPI003332A69C
MKTTTHQSMRRQRNCVPRATSLPLDHTPQAPHRARRHTSTTLRGWGLSRAVVDDAVLIVSELVTNAYLHARTETVGLELLLDAGQLVISVHDGSPAPVDVTTPCHTPGCDHGRGLGIIRTLAHAVGCSPTATGKTVWALMAV